MPKIHVFVSWSGKKSKRLAKRLHQWLPSIVPSVKVFFSSAIDPGVQWADRVSRAIEDNHFAILCVARNNLKSQWLNFEAGALWKAKNKVNVCPLLLDLSPNDLKGPLALFQAKKFEKEDFKEICKLLAKKTSLNSEQLENNFKAVWPQLKKKAKKD